MPQEEGVQSSYDCAKWIKWQILSLNISCAQIFNSALGDSSGGFFSNILQEQH